MVVCTPGFVWGQQLEAEYKRRSMGECSTFRERKITRESCYEYGEMMSASLLLHHMERSHGRVMTKTWGVDVGKGGRIRMWCDYHTC